MCASDRGRRARSGCHRYAASPFTAPTSLGTGAKHCCEAGLRCPLIRDGQRSGALDLELQAAMEPVQPLRARHVVGGLQLRAQPRAPPVSAPPDTPVGSHAVPGTGDVCHSTGTPQAPLRHLTEQVPTAPAHRSSSVRAACASCLHGCRPGRSQALPCHDHCWRWSQAHAAAATCMVTGVLYPHLGLPYPNPTCIVVQSLPYSSMLPASVDLIGRAQWLSVTCRRAHAHRRRARATLPSMGPLACLASCSSRAEHALPVMCKGWLCRMHVKAPSITSLRQAQRSSWYTEHTTRRSASPRALQK